MDRLLSTGGSLDIGKKKGFPLNFFSFRGTSRGRSGTLSVSRAWMLFGQGCSFSRALSPVVGFDWFLVPLKPGLARGPGGWCPSLSMCELPPSEQ